MPQLFKFTGNIADQPAITTKSFGEKSINEFRVTSSFDITSPIEAYAMLPGTILLQQQTAAPTKANLILKPDKNANLKLGVKYIIYRGLDLTEFVSSTTLTDVATVVKTTGLEVLDDMTALQTVRAPGDDIPVEALFGSDLSPALTKKIDEFFFKALAVSSQLFPVDGGVQIGNFAVGEVGIEIILENPEYTPDVEMARKPSHKINVSSIPDVALNKWNKDFARYFVDPAAFYGLHFDIADGIEYRDVITTKLVTTTPAEVFDKIIQPFVTRNYVYLDIRNENNYSYNYYDNYLGSVPNADDELKIGQTSGSLAFADFYDDGWPVYVEKTIVPSTTLTENEIFIKLRVNDNERPLLAARYTTVSPISVQDGNTIFVDESELLPFPIPATLPEFTKEVSIKIPNKLVAGSEAQIATLVQLRYFKQALPLSSSLKFPRVNFTDFLFGPANIVVPFDGDNNIEWITSTYTTYVDALNDGFIIGRMKTPIISIDVAQSEIEIFGDIPVDIDAKVSIENSLSNPQNVDTFDVSLSSYGGVNTTIKVAGIIAGPLQAGDELQLDVKVIGEFDYTRNTFIIKGDNYSALPAFIAGSQIDFHSNYKFANSFDINLPSFGGGNTELEFTTPKTKVGFAAVMETGIIVESDFSTSGNNDNDRFVYYAASQDYFSKDGAKHGTAFANKGGALDLTSILNALEQMMPGVAVDETVLKLSVVTSTSAFSYSSASKATDMLFLLGLAKDDISLINLAVGTALTSSHLQLYKLKPLNLGVRDMNGVLYSEFELQVTGQNSSGNYHTVDTALLIYTTDNIIFSSLIFGEEYGIDLSIATQVLDDFINDTLNPLNDPLILGSDLEELAHSTTEEVVNLSRNRYWQTYGSGKPNIEMFQLDPTMATKVTDLRTALDAAPETIAGIEAVIKLKGADLLQHAKARIRMPAEVWTNKDGILYLTRLIMQVVVKNHPIVLTKFPAKVQDFTDLFDKHSRGLEGTEKPDFSSATDFKILMTGYDPFGVAFLGYEDWQGYQSNSSGNIALSMDGVEVSIVHNGITRKALIETAILPVRFREFDAGWIEGFFQSYVDDPSVNMIVTFSYGIEKTGGYDFEIERFAARMRGIGTPDNDGAFSTASSYLNNSDKDPFEFLLNKLPICEMQINGEIGLDQAFTLDFYNGSSRIIDYSEPNPGSNLFKPTLVPFPTYANYQTKPGGSLANAIKSVAGPGGDYLSNEVFYRVAFLREKSAYPNKFTGHIHLGYLKGDPDDHRPKMLTDIQQSLTNSIQALVIDDFMRILDPSYASNDFFTHILDHTDEEENQLSTIWSANSPGLGNKALFELDPMMATRVRDYKEKLDLISCTITFSEATTFVETEGAALLQYAKASIRQVGQNWTNKDGLVYLSRLMMQVILKNHRNITSVFSTGEISDLYDSFEKHSRGLDGTEKPDFTSYPATDKKILITGFDPYGAGFDWQDHNSNPSGNMALALDGTSVLEGGVTGNIRAAVFPVRYKEFDAGWVEAFFMPHITDVDIIITFSYRSYHADATDFQIDRFASDFRYGTLDDNDFQTAPDVNLNIGDTFIENMLPYSEFATANMLVGPGGANASTIGINHRAYWEVYADKISPASVGDNVTPLHSLKQTFGPFGSPYTFWSNLDVIPITKITTTFDASEFGKNSQVSSDLKYATAGDPDEIKFPSWTDYQGTGAWIANHNNFSIKARIGSGQFYHSNEIAYRVSNLRNPLPATNLTIRTGHIHIGFLHKDAVNGLVEDRDDMLEAANHMIKKMLNAL